MYTHIVHFTAGIDRATKLPSIGYNIKNRMILLKHSVDTSYANSYCILVHIGDIYIEL